MRCTYLRTERNIHAETALLKVKQDICHSLDQGYVVILLLLDMSSTFDTVNHSLLLQRLENEFGLQATALKW